MCDKLNVIVIDDEESVASMLEMLLNRLGFNAVSFTKSKEAIEYFNKNIDSIGTVVSDLHLINDSGEAVLSKLQAMNTNLMCILITGAGVGDYMFPTVNKPFLIEEVVDAIGATS